MLRIHLGDDLKIWYGLPPALMLALTAATKVIAKAAMTVAPASVRYPAEASQESPHHGGEYPANENVADSHQAHSFHGHMVTLAGSSYCVKPGIVIG